ncbi:MAG TPA: hypothetical protein VGD10_09235 [Allosphingosinicella sp.]|uniref:hypothetical protein n=1 Tax=Allosphingosinicella sp. TaxID=2823234 RepID=UPI002EDA9CFD
MRGIWLSIPAAAAAALTGCATIYDLDNRRPDGRYVSQRSMAELAGCVSSGMRNLGPVDTERGDGFTRLILRTQAGNPAAIATVRATAGGSNVSVRQTINYSLGPVIQRCL